MMSRSTRLIEIVALFLISLGLFCWGLASQEIIGFESRFYFFAIEMLNHGVSWFPTTYHQPYPDYPVTSTLLIYLCALMLGGLNKLSAVLPSATMAALSLIFTYLIAAIYDKRWGLYSVFFLLLTFSFFQNARTLSIDMYLTMITSACFYLMYTSVNKPIKFLGTMSLLIFGFCIRGPIGLIIPTAVITSSYLLDKQYNNVFKFGILTLSLLIICMLSFLLLAYHVGGTSFMNAVLHMEIFGRLQQGSLSSYYYLLNGLTNYSLSFPFAFLVAVAVIYTVMKTDKVSDEQRLLLKLIGWVLIIMLGMSIPGDKKARYILSISPAIAMLASYPMIAKPSQTLFIFIRQIQTIIFKFFPLILIILLLYVKKHSVTIPIRYSSILVLLSIAQLINLCSRKSYIFLLMTTLSFMVFYFSVFEKFELFHEQGGAFVRQIETLRLADHAQLAFYRENTDGLPIKYLINTREHQTPVFVQHERDLIQLTTPTFFVTNQSSYDQLSPQIAKQFRIVEASKLWHQRVVVFTKV